MCKMQDAIVRSLDGLISLLMSDEWRNKVHEIINIGGSEIYKVNGLRAHQFRIKYCLKLNVLMWNMVIYLKSKSV